MSNPIEPAGDQHSEDSPSDDVSPAEAASAGTGGPGSSEPEASGEPEIEMDSLETGAE